MNILVVVCGLGSPAGELYLKISVVDARNSFASLLCA